MKNTLEIICVNTGTKYSNWYVDNLKHMIDNYSCLEYSDFHVITEDRYEGVFNKLIMFEQFTTNQYIYFDLDVVITGDCRSFVKNDLHVCKAWWREAYHTPLNSSIISWNGNRSDIYAKFIEDPDYFMVKYHKGIDQYLYENFDVSCYEENFCSFQTIQDNQDYSVVLFNQRYEYMQQDGWWRAYCSPAS